MDNIRGIAGIAVIDMPHRLVVKRPKQTLCCQCCSKHAVALDVGVGVDVVVGVDVDVDVGVGVDVNFDAFANFAIVDDIVTSCSTCRDIA